MDLSFWQERWQQGKIGFHEGKPNELLVRHCGLLDGRVRVLVPLAGKTVDMLLLASRGHDVVGVEGVELACRAFFDDNGLPAVIEDRPPFRVLTAGITCLDASPGLVFPATPASRPGHVATATRLRCSLSSPEIPVPGSINPSDPRCSGGRVTLWCGDMFAATPERLGTFDAAWDRAALVAVAPLERIGYVETLRALLKPGGRVLMVTFSYDQSKLSGPPWSIDEGTVRALFLRDFVVEPLGGGYASRGPRFADAGVDVVREEIFLLTRMGKAVARRPPGA